MSQDRDYIVRATAAEGSIRAFAITSRHLVEEARVDHDTSPVITAALGRLLSGAAMMGTMMKGEKDLLTIQIQCGGPAKGFTVTADANGHVKGFPNVPDVELPLNAQGKLDVGGALGLGVMSVIKDMGLKEPYVGQIALQTGEIAEDLTYYFATSVRGRTRCSRESGPVGQTGGRIYHPADAVYTGRRGGSSREEDHGDCLRHGDAGRWEDTGGDLGADSRRVRA